MTRPRIDHIGIIVGNLEQAIARFSVLFPEGPSSRTEMADVGLRVAKFDAENIVIEFLEYTDAEVSLAAQTMGRQLGLNHITLEVGDMETAIGDLAGQGFRLQAGFPRPGAHGIIAFFEPDENTGLLLEICQSDGALP